VDVIAGTLGADILLLDLTGLTIIADFFVIATAENVRQLEAMARHVVEEMKEKQGLTPLAVEGTPESGWILLDYGSIVVHCFSAAQRNHYKLESFWDKARTVVRLA